MESGDRTDVFWGWVLASALMIGAGLVQAFLGVKAEQRGLEDVAKPVSAGGGRGNGTGAGAAAAPSLPARAR